MLYILKVACLLQKYEKNGMLYQVRIKTNMFTTEIRKKTGMLYILKLECLLQKYGKNGYVIHIKTSMFTTEKTAMLYIGNHKIHELSVE